MATLTIKDIINLNNKAVGAIDKYLSTQTSIVLQAKAYTPAELKAAIQANLAALANAEETRLRYLRLVAENRAKRKAAVALHHALKSYVTLQFGVGATDVLGEFGFTPKAASVRSVAMTVEAIAKAKATRLARHTMGRKQRLAIKAPVQPVAPVVPSDGQLRGWGSSSTRTKVGARTKREPPSSVFAVPVRQPQRWTSSATSSAPKIGTICTSGFTPSRKHAPATASVAER